MILNRTHKMIRATMVFALCIASLLTMNVPAKAQVSGATLSGVITDESGAVTPNAKISIKNTDTSETRDVESNSDGFYTAPNLLPGPYEVTVAAPGFTTVVQKSLTLTVGAAQPLNITLHVGKLTQTVEVNDVPPAVETASSTISGTVNSTTMRELPLNGRDYTSLATLEPGVLSIPTQVGTGISANKGNRGLGNQLSDSGHRPYENSYRINGVNVNDYSNGAPGSVTGVNLGVDAIQEFSVLTTNYTAEYGRTSGAVINAITKSGANQVHGTGFFFDRDKIFDAKNFFDDPTKDIPSFRRIQFGGAAGGPIIKDRTFIFGAYEGIRQALPSTAVIKVPSQNARNGLLTGGAVVVDPGVKAYLPLFPCPAVCASGLTDTVSFATAAPIIAKENYYSTRVDHKISNNDSLAGNYFFDSGPQSQPDPLINVIHNVFARRQGVSIEETHIFGPAFVNTFRVGLNRVRGDINEPQSAPNALANSPTLAIAPGATATPKISVTGLTAIVGLGGNNQFFHHYTSGQLYDDGFLTRGTHSIKVGFAAERMQYNILERLSPNGSLKYASLSAFLRNTPVKLTALAPGGSQEVGIRESLFGAYVQDDWRARSNLSVNMGLRYEMTTKPTDAKNRFQQITSLAACTASPTACGPVAVNSPFSRNPTLKNFEPRIGLSYDPFKDGKTALRAGFGIFDVLPLPYIFGLNDAATFPFQIIGSDPAARLGTAATVNFNPATIRQRYIDPLPRRSYVLNYNFNLQRELFPGWTTTMGYVGSRSVHLPNSADDINLTQPAGQTALGLLFPKPGTGTKLDPNRGPIRPVVFDGAASYNGLQAQLKKSMSHGFQGQLSYTWGKCRDLGSSAHTGDPYLNTIAVPIFDKKYRTGACDFDIRQTTVGNFIWDVPAPQFSNSVASFLTGGWELGSIVTVTTGSPFSATLGGGGDPLGTGFDGDFSMDFANIIPGCNPIHGGVNYLNVNCFSLPTAPASMAAQCAGFAGAAQPAPAGSVYCSNLVGNAGRNSLYGPGIATVNFSVFKNTHVARISEAFNVQFRAEIFNLFNHPNLGAPGFLNPTQNNSVFAANGSVVGNAGVLNTTSTPSRQIQLGMKIVF